jgi:hypothetical protein
MFPAAVQAELQVKVPIAVQAVQAELQAKVLAAVRAELQVIFPTAGQAELQAEGPAVVPPYKQVEVSPSFRLNIVSRPII